MKKKNIFLGIIIVFILLGVVLGVINFRNKDTKEIKDKKVTYLAYVKINPLVKLTISNVYHNCRGNDIESCELKKSEVTKIDFLNDDAKKAYGNLVVTGKNIDDVISLLIVEANKHDFNVNLVNVTSNWALLGNENINNIKSKLDKDITSNLKIDIKYVEKIDEAQIIKSDEKKNYKVTFLTEKDNVFVTKDVLENELVSKPENPKKDGYEFLEWQIDGKTYDFNSKVTGDLTLLAKWKKVSVPTASESKKEQKNEQTNVEEPKNEQTNVEEPKKEEKKCQSKKFTKKYTYVYDSEETCKKEGNNNFFYVADNVDDTVFSYGCEKIVDECGATYYGVIFYKWSEEKGEYPFNY